MRIHENSTPVVVLVSSQHGGLGIIRSLGRAGVPVYSVHQELWEPSSRSRYLWGVFRWDFSSAPAVNSVSFLLEVAKQIGRRPILIATSDITALFLAENANALEEGYIFSSPPVEAVRSFSSKKQTSELCRKLGIPTAETALPQSRDDVLNFAQTKTFPIIVKGEDGPFLRKPKHRERVAIVTTEKDLLEIYDLNAGPGDARFILQEYIPGGDETIWMFNGYFNERSECLFGATGQKLRQFPSHRGSACLGICAKNEVVVAQTKQLMRAVAYRGPLDVGYRFDARDGLYKVLDVNPRIGATFRLFVSENELDVARTLYLDLTGQSIPAAQFCEGRKWIVESNDLLSCWASFREGQLTPNAWLRSLRGVQEGAWLDGDDLAPLMGLPTLWFRKRFQKRPGSLALNRSKVVSG
jgi:predicted ATP-grasp superfamily ATP-dependent carboligase